MTSTVTSVPHDLYPDLGPEQRAHLGREWRPSRRDAVKLGPYPVDSGTAAAVEAIQRDYILPWNMVRDRHLAAWVRDYFIAKGALDIPLINPPLTLTKLKLFRRIGEARKYWSGEDYQNGQADVPDATYEEVFARLQAVVAALALEDPVKAGAALSMPELPFGPSAMRFIPLIDNEWLDLEVLVLCEVGTLLESEGMLRLPPAEPHPLAWDRFFPEDADWSDPKSARPVRPEVVVTACAQARANLSRCHGKIRTVGGRPHLRVEHYSRLRGRHIRDSLEARRVEGLLVKFWNDWIDHESGGSCWVEVADFLVGKVEHPCMLTAGRDYRVVPGARACRDALAQRAEATAELHGRPTAR